MITEVITFWGIVQGVGFRPTLSRLAAKYRMRGQVRNMGAFVQLIVTDEPERIGEFVEVVQAGKPRMADIMRIDREVIDTVPFDDFRIVSSATAEDEIAAVPADIAVCGECLSEFRNPANSRYMHPFISCTNCGPRYTIMERLPYDRDTTAMMDFSMCPSCGAEYTDPASRRYHAQTVSCHECGPQAIWHAGRAASVAHGNAAISEAIGAIRGGGVITLKGVGGYYFVCSPFDENAVERLRDIKLREHKPFAVMFSSVEGVRAYCELNDEEETLFTSPKRPIVLLEQHRSGEDAAPPLAPGVLSTSRFIGAFLPSMALQYMLISALGPLVMTSANIAGLPIIRDDEEMLSLAARDGRVAGILYNGRRIVRGIDDSVARVCDGKPQLIRRSKGWTPVPIYLRGTDSLSKNDRIFAAGADLKSAFALTKGSFVYMSQYIGDMENIETERVYGGNLADMEEFFDITPCVVAHDAHPLYRTAEIAKEYAETKGAQLLAVQHHHAHIASVMAEHGLVGPVIGVAFDGTGYGADGTIWGGEILICECAEFERFSYLRNIEMIGGDASMRDAWKSAACRLAGARRDYSGKTHEDRVQATRASNVSVCPKGERTFDIDISYVLNYAEENDTLNDYEADRRMIEAAVLGGVNTVRTSSMGRLFDAVSALLGIHHVNRYEGECAVMLENAAQRAISSRAVDQADAFALRFHMDVCRTILAECRAAREERGVDTICLSGGIFQNKILIEETLRLLHADGFTPYYNIAVPPNDGGVALGQAYVAMQRILTSKQFYFS
ncbi:MAG: carbamoyltransferase HypF [Clostridiales Family XIII bacterium]|jgi:hydrogenase maturation protein HypF|nr:carbamoyltransferase HypF [Clostridiales Family XIII bacterium]